MPVTYKLDVKDLPCQVRRRKVYIQRCHVHSGTRDFETHDSIHLFHKSFVRNYNGICCGYYAYNEVIPGPCRQRLKLDIDIERSTVHKASPKALIDHIMANVERASRMLFGETLTRPNWNLYSSLLLLVGLVLLDMGEIES